MTPERLALFAEDQEMKTQIATAMLLATLAIPVAQASDDADECIGPIDTVQYTLNVGTLYADGICTDYLDSHKKGERTCKSLNSKLDGASEKLSVEKLNAKKIAGAVKKLDDFQAIIDSLAMRYKPIISGDDYNALNQPLAEAKSCVGSL